MWYFGGYMRVFEFPHTYVQVFDSMYVGTRFRNHRLE